MGTDITSLKSITIPEGNVKSISVNGVEIWSKSGGEPPALLSWDHVLWSIENNRYTSDYSVGDLIPLDLGTEGLINMQIAGFNVDTASSGESYTHISFISKELLTTPHRVNPVRSPSSSPFNEGTGGIGGWSKCELRTYLKTIIKTLIPEKVRSAIIEINKTTWTFDVYGNAKTVLSTNNDIWIPTIRNLNLTAKETSGAIYSTLFPNNASRIKCVVGSTIPAKWITSSCHNTASGAFWGIDATGSNSSVPVTDDSYICFGFCL